MTTLSRVRARLLDKMPHRRLVLSGCYCPRFASADLRVHSSQRHVATSGSASRHGRCFISSISPHRCRPNGPWEPASRHVSQVSRQNSNCLSKKRCADRCLRVARDTLFSCPRHHFLPSCFSPPCLQLPPPPKPSFFHMFAICSILAFERESHGGMAAWVFTSRLEGGRACC